MESLTIAHDKVSTYVTMDNEALKQIQILMYLRCKCQCYRVQKKHVPYLTSHLIIYGYLYLH